MMKADWVYIYIYVSNLSTIELDYISRITVLHQQENK